MANFYLRIAKELDFNDISRHLLVVGELTGDCFSCRQVGINYTKEKYCPQCQTDFKYIAYRKSPNAITGAQISRLMSRRPDLTYVEYQDVKEISDRKKAKDFFK